MERRCHARADLREPTALRAEMTEPTGARARSRSASDGLRTVSGTGGRSPNRGRSQTDSLPSGSVRRRRSGAGRGEQAGRRRRQDRQVEQRPADARTGRVERRGHRLQRRLEGEERGDDPDRVVERRADGAGGDQREEGDRQGDHEGEQRDRRGPRAPPPRAPPRPPPAPPPPARIATSQRPKRLQSSGDEEPSPASISRVTTSPTATPSTTFSASSAERETSPRVRRGKAFSSRSSASEPATSSTVTKARVRVAATAIAKTSSGGVEALTTCLSTAIGWARRSISGAATSRLSRASVANADHLVQRVAQLRRAAAPGRSASRIRAVVAQAEDLDRLAEHARTGRRRRAGSGIGRLRSRSAARSPGSPGPAGRRSGRRPARALTGSSSLTITSTFGRPRRRGRERVDPVDQVGGQDQRRQHVAGADLVDRLRRGPRRATHSTRSQIRSLTPTAGSCCAADADPGVRRHFVEEGDPRLLRSREIAKPTRTAISIG